MQIKLLGRPTVIRDGASTTPSRRVGETLAVLALNPGQRIDNRKLSGLLFPDSPPSEASWRSLVSKVRAIVGNAALPNAYGETRLIVDPEQVDYFRFISLVTQARDEQGAHRARLLCDALDLWPDITPLEGTNLPYLDDKRAEMEARRAEALTALVEAELADNQFKDALTHAREAPTRCWDSEHFFELYLTALAECREFSELKSATADYERRVDALVSPSLRQHWNYLLSDEFVPRRPQATLDANSSTPRQLPAGRSALIGRERELAEIRDSLSRPGSITVVHGTAGVGKTQLALLAARKCQDAFEGGTLFADLLGFSPDEPRDARQQLLSWLPRLGVSVKENRLDNPAVSTDDLAAVYRSELARRQVLVVLDNARDADQVRPLLPPPDSSACLITSRNTMMPLASSYDARMVTLLPWTTGTGTEFLTEILGGRRVSADLSAARMLVEHCAGLPLTLSLVGARLAVRQDLNLGIVAGELADLERRLTTLDRTATGPSVSAALDWSVRALREETIDAFRHIGVLPELAITAESLSSVLLWTRSEASHVIDELVTASILQPADEEGLFAMHDVLRAHAGTLAADLDPMKRRHAEQRALDFALYQAVACDNVLDPGRALPVPPPPDGISVKNTKSIASSLRLLELCYPTFQSALRLADRLELHQYLVYLPVVLSVFYRKSARWNDQVVALRQASRSAELWAPPSECALVHRMLGSAYNYVGQANLAILCQKRGIQISLENGDYVGEARGRQLLGVAYEKAGQLDLARPCYERSLELFEELGDERGRGHAHNGMASVELAEGNLPSARTSAMTALAAAHGADDVNGQSAAERNLARIEAALGDTQASVESYRRARARYLADNYITAAVLVCGREADLLDEHSPDDARAVREQAITLLSDLPSPHPSDIQLLNELRAAVRIDTDQV